MADHDILNFDVVAIATSTARGDDDVGLILVYHLGSAEGCIDLAHATLLNDDVAVLKQVLQLLQLLVHCYNNSYLHVVVIV